MHTPGLLAFNIASPCYNWYFYTEPQKNLNNRRLFYPRFVVIQLILSIVLLKNWNFNSNSRGRVLGGSSQLNAMCYIRGQASDYDRWAELTGDEKFSYQNVLPYFKKSQSAIGYGDDEYNGRNGEIKVTKNNMDALPYGTLCKAQGSTRRLVRTPVDASWCHISRFNRFWCVDP